MLENTIEKYDLSQFYSKPSYDINLFELDELDANESSLNYSPSKLSSVPYTLSQAVITIVSQAVSFKSLSPTKIIAAIAQNNTELEMNIDRSFFFVINNSATVIRPLFEQFTNESKFTEKYSPLRVSLLAILVALLSLNVILLYPLTRNVVQSVNEVFNLFYSIPNDLIDKVVTSAEGFMLIVRSSYSLIFSHFKNSTFKYSFNIDTPIERPPATNDEEASAIRQNTIHLASLLESEKKEETANPKAINEGSGANETNGEAIKEEDVLIQKNKAAKTMTTLSYQTNQGKIIKTLAAVLIITYIYFAAIFLLDFYFQNLSSTSFKVISCFLNWSSYISWSVFANREIVDTNAFPKNENNVDLFADYYNKTIQGWDAITSISPILESKYASLSQMLKKLDSNSTCSVLQPEDEENCIKMYDGFLERGLISAIFNVITSLNDLYSICINNLDVLHNSSLKMSLNSNQRFASSIDLKQMYIDYGVSLYMSSIESAMKSFTKLREVFIYGCLFSTLVLQCVMIIVIAILFVNKYRADIIRVRQMIHILPKIIAIQFTSDINKIIAKIR